MTKDNDTQTKLYDQLMKVRRHIDALKDVYENIPGEDRYSSVFSIIGERLEVEFDALNVLVFKTF